jgi:hypothetical protein
VLQRRYNRSLSLKSTANCGSWARLQAWIVQLHARVGYHKTLVAIANKHARMIWAILAKGEDYDPDAWRRWSRSAPAISGVTP